MKDRLVFVVVLLFIAGLTWFTLTFVDNHGKWDKCSGGPHYFEYEGEYHSEKWGKTDLYTCRDCGFQYIQLHGVSPNEETENVMAIKPIFSNEFSEYYILYQESYSLPKYIHIKEEDIKLFKVKKYEQE